MFSLTPDLTGGDIDSEETTKILISDLYRYEVKFFPSIIIKSGGKLPAPFHLIKMQHISIEQTAL